jgi:hypothetical protein
MILHPFYKTGFDKTTVKLQKQKFLSNSFHAQNCLENGKDWSFVSNTPLDMPFDRLKQSRRDYNSLGQINFSSELVTLIY